MTKVIAATTDRRVGPRVTPSQTPLGYTDESLQHYLKSQYIRKFLTRKGTASPSSAKTYATHLKAFAFYVYKVHGLDVDAFIGKIKAGEHDPYDILADFAKFLRESRMGMQKLGGNHISQMVKSTKRCMRMNGVAVINEDFREFVSLPRKVRKVKSPIDKLTVSRLLSSSKDFQLSSFIMFHAVLGPRPIEAAAVRMADLDLDSDIPKVTFRAEYTKTRVERTRYLTEELVAQLKLWLKYKYRKHRTMGKDRKTIVVTPEPRPEDLVFAHWHMDGVQPKPENVYDTLRVKCAELADTLGTGWENDNRRRKITLYSLRRLVKSTISDLGYGDFSEFWIGHLGSTYYNKPEAERIQLFKKIEPYLTYLDIAGLEARGADVKTQLEEKDEQLRTQKHEIQNLYKILYDKGIIEKEPA